MVWTEPGICVEENQYMQQHGNTKQNSKKMTTANEKLSNDNSFMTVDECISADDERTPSNEVLQKCGHCGKSFSRFSNLSRHMKVSHVGQRFPCLTCNQNFTCKEGLLRHIHIVHENLRCEVCFNIFGSTLLKDLHECRGEHKLLNSISCSVCYKTFSSKSNMNKHKQVAHFGRTFTCATCFKVLRSRESNVEHNRSAHGIFLCSKCNRTFVSEEEFVQHVAQEHHFFISLESEPECEKQGKREKNLFKTRRKHIPVSCDRCGKVFSSKSNLTKHIRFVHGKEKPKHQQHSDPNSCSKQQPSASQDQSIMFKCTLCPLKFYQRRSLGKHQLVAHNRLVSDGGCQCELCGKTFLYECNRKRHLKRDHEESRFACHECNLQFSNTQAAEEHQFTKHGSPELTASEYSNTFPSFNKRQEHARCNLKNQQFN